MGQTQVSADAKAVADALNRVADANFQQAKAYRAHVKLIEEQVAISKELRDMQKVQLNVTRQLEQRLMMQGDVGGNS